MKYCQGPMCHEHKTKDRIRGPKGDKHYETRRRTHLAKRTDCDGAWYKHRDWRNYGDGIYYFINDLLGERRPITEQQYNDEDYTLNT